MAAGSAGRIDRTAPLERTRSVFLLVDLQSRLLPAIDSGDRVLKTASALLDGARLLDVPVVFTEHCAEAIGGTDPGLLDQAPTGVVVSKVHFDATADGVLTRALDPIGRPDVVVAGTEAHVCVLQTALGLLRSGYRTFVVRDAIGSRKPVDKQAAIDRLDHAGADLVTAEMVLFEWLHRGDTSDFKALLPTIKALG